MLERGYLGTLVSIRDGCHRHLRTIVWTPCNEPSKVLGYMNQVKFEIDYSPISSGENVRMWNNQWTRQHIPYATDYNNMCSIYILIWKIFTFLRYLHFMILSLATKEHGISFGFWDLIPMCGGGSVLTHPSNSPETSLVSCSSIQFWHYLPLQTASDSTG